jgi:hypothetical protein
MIRHDARMAFLPPVHRGLGCRDAEYKVKKQVKNKKDAYEPQKSQPAAAG